MNSENMSRNFWFTVYKKDIELYSLIDIIQSFHVSAFISPLHIDSGNEDSYHFHIMLMYSGKKSISSIERKLKIAFDQVPFYKLEICSDKVACARYLCHLDNKNKKYVYDPNDVVSLSGAYYDDYAYSRKSKESVLTSVLLEIDSFDCIVSYDTLLIMYLKTDKLKFDCMISPRFCNIVRNMIDSHNYSISHS